MFEIDSESSFDVITQQSTLPIAAGAYISMMISDHFISYVIFLGHTSFTNCPKRIVQTPSYHLMGHHHGSP